MCFLQYDINIKPCLLNFYASFKSPLKKSTKTAFANSQILLRNMRYWDIVERKGRDFNLRYAKKWKQYLNVDSVVKRSKICYLINWILQNYLYDEKNTFYLRTGSLHRKYQKNLLFAKKWKQYDDNIDKYLCIPKQ